jgi:3',5'-cyclic AMP phosphodiesterase CpdA
MRLATFVHVSDLHFGNVDPNSVDKDAVAVALGAVGGPIFDGLLGHSHRSLVRLEQLWAKLKDEEDAALIVTGDLTAFGAISQFQSATTYLADILGRPTVVNPIGLRHTRWNHTSVPGNHDHWPGRPVIFGWPTSGLAEHFSGLPNVFRFDLSPGQFLSFLRIDTDANVNPLGTDRFLALGRFNSQLATLASQLPVPEANEIRVLLLHHSLSVSGQLAMTSASKDALNDFIVDHAISILLCGHIHQPPTIKLMRKRQRNYTVDERLDW